MVFGIVTRAILISVAVVTVDGFVGNSHKRMTNIAVKSSPPMVHQTSLASTVDSTSSSASSTPNAETDGAVRAIIFDIDGTLADSWNLGFQATKTVLTDYHNDKNRESLTAETYPLTSEEYHYGCRYTTPERLARHVGLNPEHPSFESVGEDLGGKFDDYYVQLVDTKTAGFYDGIGSLLVKLHSGDGDSSSMSGVQLGALTNACVEYAHAVLKANCPECSSDTSSSSSEGKDNSIYQRFSSIHGANSVPRPKPFGDGIQKCCDEMGLHPSQVIYVGDAPTDARAAVDAQCRTAIGVLWGSNDEETLKKEEGFTALCSTVEELEQAIAKYL
mmetsp:Transcript_26710/g.57465  ORF Transcript_26710/g.57465 Transcript_26710/m.57465 type:complete len:331 (-) Transcript_26710:43-1035(-)